MRDLVPLQLYFNRFFEDLGQGAMVRDNSNSVVSEKKRKKRLNADSSNEDEIEDDRDNGDMEEDREDILGI